MRIKRTQLQDKTMVSICGTLEQVEQLQDDLYEEFYSVQLIDMEEPLTMNMYINACFECHD